MQIYQRTWGSALRDPGKEALRTWREENGFIPKPVELSKAELKRQRKALKARQGLWEVWAEQGLTITDPDAILYLAKKRIGEKIKKGETVYSWSIQGIAKNLSGGVPLAGLDQQLKAVVDAFDEKRDKRRERKVVVEPLGPKKRLEQKCLKAVRDAVNAADFRYRYNKHSPDITLVPALPQNAPYASMVDIKSHRRGKSDSHVLVTVLTDWVRRVGPERAGMFGPGTLVLGLWEIGNRLRATVATQDKRGYAIKLKTGWVTKNADGTAVLGV